MNTGHHLLQQIYQNLGVPLGTAATRGLYLALGGQRRASDFRKRRCSTVTVTVSFAVACTKIRRCGFSFSSSISFSFFFPERNQTLKIAPRTRPPHRLDPRGWIASLWISRSAVLAFRSVAARQPQRPGTSNRTVTIIGSQRPPAQLKCSFTARSNKRKMHYASIPQHRSLPRPPTSFTTPCCANATSSGAPPFFVLVFNFVTSTLRYTASCSIAQHQHQHQNLHHQPHHPSTIPGIRKERAPTRRTTALGLGP